MESVGDRWNEITKKIFARHPDDVSRISVILWERLAAELDAIIGTDGFQSIYSRSVHLTIASFPWVAKVSPSLSDEQNHSRFNSLEASLQTQNFAEASEASLYLLRKYTDILILLIGESLTATILSTAWGNDNLEGFHYE